MGLMSSIVSAGSVVLQYGINGLGTLTIAGHTAARKLFAFTDMPLISMANAGSTFVSQNRGANQPDRVRRGMRQMYLYSVVVMVAAVVLMSFGAQWMVQLISGSSEPIVLENGARYLLWNAPFYAVLGVLLCTRYALQSLGQKVLPLFSSVIELVGKAIFVLVFIPKFQYNAVILCEPIIWFFMTAYLVAVYLHEPLFSRKNNPLSYRCAMPALPKGRAFCILREAQRKLPLSGELDANKVSRLKGVTAPNSQSCSPAHRCAGRPCTGGSRGCQSWRSPAGWRGQRWR